jgi:hypothetical protein
MTDSRRNVVDDFEEYYLSPARQLIDAENSCLEKAIISQGQRRRTAH